MDDVQGAAVRSRPWLGRAIALALVCVAVAAGVRGCRHRRDQAAAVERVDLHFEKGYVESALAELDDAPDPDAPACRERFEKARVFLAAALSMEIPDSPAGKPTAPPRGAGGLDPVTLAHRPPTLAEAQKVQNDFQVVIAQIQQGKSVRDAAAQLNVPQSYVRALLRCQAP